MNRVAFQILIGSMLGDGCITKNTRLCKNYCFREMHGESQREYVVWKAAQLGFGAIACGKRPELFTRTMPIFTRLRNEFYGTSDQKCLLPKSHYKFLNELGLLIWYLDDGTWQQGQLAIKCELFDVDDLQWLVDQLNTKMGLSLRIYDYDYTRLIAFRKSSRENIMPAWQELMRVYKIPSSMSYKLVGKDG